MLNAKEKLDVQSDELPKFDTADNIPSLIESLNHLKTQALITEEEFTTKKSQLLKKI